jgi:hypothetical protein
MSHRVPTRAPKAAAGAAPCAGAPTPTLTSSNNAITVASRRDPTRRSAFTTTTTTKRQQTTHTAVAVPDPRAPKRARTGYELFLLSGGVELLQAGNGSVREGVSYVFQSIRVDFWHAAFTLTVRYAPNRHMAHHSLEACAPPSWVYLCGIYTYRYGKKVESEYSYISSTCISTCARIVFKRRNDQCIHTHMYIATFNINFFPMQRSICFE